MGSEPIILQMFKSREVWDFSVAKLLAKKKIKGQDRQYLEVLFTTKPYDDIIKQILSNSYSWSIPRKYEIAKIGSTKKRIVYVHSIRDRVVLGVLNAVYSEYYKDKVNQSVFSYKEGERTLSAVKSLLKDQNIASKYGVKLDISAYFNSVSEPALHKIIEELHESKELTNLLNALLFYNKVQVLRKVRKEDGLYLESQILDEYASLIPGSPFSGFLANYALLPIDDWLSSQPDITYARYSDDMIIFTNTPEERKAVIEGILERLAPLGLTINPDKYTYYEPGDEVTFLGLKFTKKDGIDAIDIADKTALKLKKKIHHECKLARNAVVLKHKSPDKEAAKIISRFNNLLYKTFLFDRTQYGWAFYVFSNISTNKTLRELDFYLINNLRFIYTGKWNDANIRKVPLDHLHILGLQSFIEMYNLFCMDRDVYAQRVSQLQPVFIDQLSLDENLVNGF